MNGLMQRADHVHQDNAESNVTKVRNSMDEFAREGFNARVTGDINNATVSGGNPFVGRSESQKVGRQSTFGSPSEVLANGRTGLPSDSDSTHYGLPSSNTRGRGHAPKSNLPSDQK